MKQLKSSYQDLHRIFRHSITAREIAEPLASFEMDYPAPKVRDFMEARDFDVVGVRSDGVIAGYVTRESLGSDTVGEYMVSVEDKDGINESDSLLDALESLRASRWVFIRFLGNPNGIITRGDLQKAPMRMWLFGLISLLEMQLLRRIRDTYPQDEWKDYLSPNRLEAAQRIFDERQRKNDSIDLAECLQIGDKKTIFRKSEKLFGLVGFNGFKKWDQFMRDVEDLRNKLAHSNGIASESWPEIASLVSGIEQCLLRLEGKATSPLP
jgi:hypothetical protein